jgi:hypothetical protein
VAQIHSLWRTVLDRTSDSSWNTSHQLLIFLSHVSLTTPLLLRTSSELFISSRLQLYPSSSPSTVTEREGLVLERESLRKKLGVPGMRPGGSLPLPGGVSLLALLGLGRFLSLAPWLDQVEFRCLPAIRAVEFCSPRVRSGNGWCSLANDFMKFELGSNFLVCLRLPNPKLKSWIWTLSPSNIHHPF